MIVLYFYTVLKMKRSSLLQWCDEKLTPNLYHDYAPNGLQVEGSDEIHSIVAAVTASEAAINHAIKIGAQALMVHHGLFWKNEPVTITGWKKKRIEKLLHHQINLIGYHLPLDAHAVLGNNAQLAKKMDWQITQLNTPDNFMTKGFLNEAASLSSLAETLSDTLGRPALALGEKGKLIKNLAWCSGGAQGYFQEAIDLGVDCFITGEVSEAQFHLANETGVGFISAGHHATEKFGIQALAEEIHTTFKVDYQFFDDKNPV